MTSRSLTSRTSAIWLALLAYLAGGMALPTTHIHTLDGKCTEVHATVPQTVSQQAVASQHVGCHHQHACPASAEDQPAEESAPHSHSVPIPEEGCRVCELQNTPAQKVEIVSLPNLSVILTDSVPIPAAIAAEAADLLVPPLRGPPCTA